MAERHKPWETTSLSAQVHPEPSLRHGSRKAQTRACCSWKRGPITRIKAPRLLTYSTRKISLVPRTTGATKPFRWKAVSFLISVAKWSAAHLRSMPQEHCGLGRPISMLGLSSATLVGVLRTWPRIFNDWRQILADLDRTTAGAARLRLRVMVKQN